MKGQKCLKILGEYFPERKRKQKQKQKQQRQQNAKSSRQEFAWHNIWDYKKHNGGEKIKMRMKERGKG